jgi:peptidoglycan lytic transglycosylase
LRPLAMGGAAVLAGALMMTIPGAADTHAAVLKKRLHVRAGERVVIVGTARAGTARLQVWHGDAWRTIDRGRTRASGRYVLRRRMRDAQSAPARVLAPGVRRKLGRLNVYRYAHASWYGPGLYGNRLGCGGTLSAGDLGVAHKSLPCGARVTLRHAGRTVRVRVIDRGPYVAGREFDLTEATAHRLRFHGHGAILTTR